jgi:uncharacterized protein (TIGR01777 family)
MALLCLFLVASRIIMKTIGITGGTGFIGGRLTAALVQRGYKVVVFTRGIANLPVKQHVTYAHWDEDRGECDINGLKTLDAVVHLAGAGIADKRWTERRKKEISDSRVRGTDFLVSKLMEFAPGCKTFIAASAIGYYGPDNHDGKPFTESDKPFKDFLGETCRQWEVASQRAQSFARTVICRFGIVLGKESGAFPQFVRPMSYGIMPILGTGSQMTSWITIDDLVDLLLYALEQEQTKGVYNAVAPNPVSHRELMDTIARIEGGIKIPIKVPAFLLKIMLGEMSIEVLKSCTVSGQKILDAGFTFKYPQIEPAVRHILGKD